VKQGLVLLVSAAAIAGLPGCSIGSSDGSGDVDDSDKQAVALQCLTEDKGIDARADGDDAISIGDPKTGPRIVFYLTSGEAEARQFEGDAEGAEQIGSALLFVRDGSDDLLGDVESCLADL
jgi:hypothetical protein